MNCSFCKTVVQEVINKINRLDPSAASIILTKADKNGNPAEKFKVADGVADDEAVTFAQLKDYSPRGDGGIGTWSIGIAKASFDADTGVGGGGDRYIHIKTNIKVDTKKIMFYFKLKGYELRGAGDEIVDVTFVGYVYSPSSVIVNKKADGTNHSPHIYKSSDGYVVLRITANPYFLTLTLDSLHLLQGGRFKKEDITSITYNQTETI